jgi:hypothetical protein
MSVALLTNRIEKLRQVLRLQKDLKACVAYRQHASQLEPLVQHFSSDIVDLVNGMSDDDIRHAYFMATALFPRQAWRARKGVLKLIAPVLKRATKNRK